MYTMYVSMYVNCMGMYVILKTREGVLLDADKAQSVSV